MEELLDIVNEQDEIIGQAGCRKVHTGQLLHRYAQVLVIRSDGKLVLQQRQHRMGHYPLTFDASVGEHVSSGESYLDAAIRGLPEELGIKTDITLLGRIENRLNPAIENMIGQLYIGQNDGPYHPQESEIARLEFMTPEEAAFLLKRYPYLICDNFKSALELYLRTRN